MRTSAMNEKSVGEDVVEIVWNKEMIRHWPTI